MKAFPKLKSKAILAPMIGITDIAFRALSKKYGAGLTYTGLTSSTALVRNKKNVSRLTIEKKIKPVAVQLFGSEIDDIVSSAIAIEKYFDIIDINCGCPATNIIKAGSGAMLMKDPEKIAKIINRLVSSIKKPVTIKIRAGFTPNKYNAIEIAKLAEDAGASAIAIHGRTKNCGYREPANWNIIRDVKNAVNIPIIGNGDVTTPEVFKQRLEQSGVDYIMLGRGAMKNPYLFTQVNNFLKKGHYNEKNKLEIIKEYIELAEKYKIAYSLIKRNIMQITTGLEAGAILRFKISKCKSLNELKALLEI
ncbi:MAG: tRNA-dihydrouridine synthase [Candidatus Aenigmatarchaeota archaeon]